MRFHMTQAFSEARTAHTDALKAVEAYEGEMEDQEFRQLSATEWSALETLMAADATTPTEIAAKVKVYDQRELSMCEGHEEYLGKILTDLKHMQGHPVSPEFRAAWSAWRKLEDEYELAAERSDEEADKLTIPRDQLYVEIAMKPCTTPGDFILKQYLRMITTLGGHNMAEHRADGTANRWDIHLGDGEDEARFERADNIGTYDDLNNCDTGMNLLAYGQPDFDPEAWMEAADRVGLQVYLAEQRDNSSGLVIGMLDRKSIMVGEDEHLEPLPERIKRERDRLRRLLAFDTDRYDMIADEIEREWPQLILRVPSRVSATETEAAARTAESIASGSVELQRHPIDAE